MARGWHSRGYLPHLDADGVIQHVVFRLADSIPKSALEKIELLDAAQRFQNFDKILDGNHGSTVLKDSRAAQIVADALTFFDGERYALYAWCVMPNHVHVVAAAVQGWGWSDIVKSWKAYSSAKINALYARSGRLWAPDYFDRFMRDDAHLAATIAYVESNPVTAGLCGAPSDWAYSSVTQEMRV